MVNFATSLTFKGDKIMTIAIILFVIGLLLQADVCSRIFVFTDPDVFMHRISRPFFIPFPFGLGVVCTYMEIIASTLLMYRALLVGHLPF